MSSNNSSREGSPHGTPRYGRFKNAILSVIKTFPQDEAAWTDQGPQTEADINALFWSLTMNHIPHQARRMMPCRFLLESFAQTMTDPQCPLHALTLAAACSVALSDGQLTFHEAAEILANVFPRPDTDLKVQRAAVARHLRFLDLVRQVTGSTRVYEIPLRSKGCLDKFNSFNHRHLELLEEMLRTGEAKIYKPKAKLDSTMLRIQNVVFHLFGGRFKYVVCSTLCVLRSLADL
ncbi:hypothetical protein B0T10DRAFT_237003 [Thelonectria olida]|uniref:Uncharacterized protein n=1 Tax=Thelonectria olida TaxID=1576542 RepID=A0A9P8WDB6_9HYPO|nr:hypothetical protein B0T10DRAFT_237003 [Thelonectria olida]